MVRGRKAKGLAGLLLLLIAGSINATPERCRSAAAFTAASLHMARDVRTAREAETGRPAERANVSNITVGDKYHKHFVNFADSPHPNFGVHVLPVSSGATGPAQSGILPGSPAKGLRLWSVILIGFFFAALAELRLLLHNAADIRFDPYSRLVILAPATNVTMANPPLSRPGSQPVTEGDPHHAALEINTPQHTFIPPDRTRDHHDVSAENPARTTRLKHSRRLALAEPTNGVNQRIDMSFHETHLIVYFSFQTISAQLARGPPAA